MNRLLLIGTVILACLCIFVTIAYACVQIDVYIGNYQRYVGVSNGSKTVTVTADVVYGGPAIISSWEWDAPSVLECNGIVKNEYDSTATYWSDTPGRYTVWAYAENDSPSDDDDWAHVYVVEVSLSDGGYLALDGEPMEVDISLLPSELYNGTVELTASGGITVWYDSGKNNQVSLPASWSVARSQVPSSVWVEGTTVSSSASLNISYSHYGPTLDEDTANFTIVDVEMKLEKVGDTTIESANNYSENTTISVTAVDADNGQTCSWFTGTVNIDEDGTDIYSQHTDKGAYLPSSVEITSSGITTFIAKSLADPIDTSTPPDPARIITTNYDVSNASGYLSVEQWTNDLGTVHTGMSSGIVYDWFETRTKDIFDNATGDLATVLSKMDYYDQNLTGDYRGQVIDWDHDALTAIHFNPHWEETRLDTDSGGYCVQTTLHAHTNTVIHEARHCYQDYLSSVNLGQSDDDNNNPERPDNDDDQDWLVETIPISPSYFILDNSGVRGK